MFTRHAYTWKQDQVRELPKRNESAAVGGDGPLAGGDLRESQISDSPQHGESCQRTADVAQVAERKRDKPCQQNQPQPVANRSRTPIARASILAASDQSERAPGKKASPPVGPHSSQQPTSHPTGRGGDRTRTGVTPHGILSPVRLPIPPLGRLVAYPQGAKVLDPGMGRTRQLDPGFSGESRFRSIV